LSPARLCFVKLFKFEYWPWKYVYMPIIPYYLYLAYKNKSMAFPSHVNIGLPEGGFFNEDKKVMLKDISEKYLPKSCFFYKNKEKVQFDLDFFPIVAKPLNAQRGSNVSIIKTAEELESYAKNLTQDFIVQEYVRYEIELAILYSRMPGESQGKVSSVTQKEFLSVTGNGHDSIWQLLETQERAMIIADDIKKNTKVDLEEILPIGIKKIVEPIGNHCRGTLFRNAAHLDFKKIALVADEILKDFEGFYYGRFDLKVKSIEDLYAGTNIKILELNGINADAAHIFDPDYKLFTAFKDIIWHWKRISDIALKNKETWKSTEDKLIWEKVKSKIF
jgi:ATP-grasp domain